MHYPDPFIRRVVIAIAIAGAAYILWRVRAVMMIVFGGMIIATLLYALASKIRQWIPVSGKVAVALTILIIISIFALVFWWAGNNISVQLREISERLPRAIEATQEWGEQFPLASELFAQDGTLQEMNVPWQKIMGFTGTAIGAIANLILIFAIAVYLAAAPDLYHRGLTSLLPPAYREQTNNAVLAAANGLRRWLLGQAFTMSVVGVLVAIGLKLLNIPLALTLGLIAGLLEFVPFIGPLAFGVLAVLLAFMEGPSAALQVGILTLAIQQLEGNVITPLVQRRAVRLPPVLGLVGVLVFGALFGIIGILLATPLMVVVMILVQKLYLEHAIEQEDDGDIVTPETVDQVR